MVNSGSGSLIVLTGPPPSARPAKIANVVLLGTNLTLSGTSGEPSGTYHVVTSTNVALSVTNWTVITNGGFDGSGDFSITVPYSTNDQHRFYSVRSP